MNINFKKNINISYMVIEDVKDFSPADFEVKMIFQNEIRGFLKSDIEVIDGKTNLLYDISSRQAFSKFFEISKMSFENLRTFIFAIKNLSKNLEEYLLDCNNIILKENCIFFDMTVTEFFFCYYPYYKGDFALEIKELMKRILKYVDYEDEKAIKLAYRLSDSVQNENFVISDLMKCFEQAVADISERVEKVNAVDREIREEIPGIEFEKIFEKENNGSIKTRDVNFEDIEWKDPYGIEQKDSLPEEKLSLFGKISAYLKGKSFMEIIDDIDNGDLVKNIKNVCSEEAFVKTELPQAVNLRPAFEGALDNSFSFADIENTFCEKPSNGTVILGKRETDSRRLAGINNSAGMSFDINKSPFTIGKMNVKADAIINSQTVSRLHARIYEESKLTGEYYIEDLNSTNGTYVNYRKIEPYIKTAINPGDIISFADEEFCFR